MSKTRQSAVAGNPSEYFFKEGCYIEEWLNNDSHQELSVARIRVAPRTTTKSHSLLGTTERYVILSGEGNVTVGEETFKVKEKDVVVIKPGQLQKIANPGDADLIFLAICTPRFLPENYLELTDK